MGSEVVRLVGTTWMGMFELHWRSQLMTIRWGGEDGSPFEEIDGLIAVGLDRTAPSLLVKGRQQANLP